MGEKIFFNKFLAHQEAKRNNKHVEFYFYDDVLNQINWTKEPEQSWEELLAMRAIELGEEYDYVRIFFSGGRDSRLALDTLVRYKIPIDEIVVMRQFEKEPLFEHNQAMHYATTIKDYVQQPKFTTIDYHLEMQTKRWNTQNWWETTKGPHLSFTSCQGGHWIEDFPELQEPYEKGLKVCNITGQEKCKIWQKDGKLYTTMLDKAVILIIGLEDHEPFFISRKVPELYAKQAWGTKKWLDIKYPNSEDSFVNDKISRADSYPYYEEFCQSQYRLPDIVPHMSDAGKIGASDASNFLHEDADITIIDQAPYGTRWKKMYEHGKLEQADFWKNYVHGMDYLRKSDTFRGFFHNDEPYGFDIGTLSKMHYMG